MLIDANFRLGNELTLPYQNADIKERSKILERQVGERDALQ